MRGMGVEVNTKVLHAEGKRIHVSSGGLLKSAVLAEQARRVTFDVQYPAGETSYATVAGMGADVEVKVNGRVLARVDNLDAAPEGWKRSAEGLLMLKIRHDEGPVKISVAEK